MRKYIIFWGFLCLCLELAAQTYPKEGNVIRILTYNTHYCKGGTDPGSINDANTRLLASVIKTLDADVVSLQELDSAANRQSDRTELHTRVRQCAQVGRWECRLRKSYKNDLSHK